MAPWNLFEIARRSPRNRRISTGISCHPSRGAPSRAMVMILLDSASCSASGPRTTLVDRCASWAARSGAKYQECHMSGVEDQQTGLAWSVDGAMTFCSDHTTFLRSRERASPILGTIGVSSCFAVYGPCGRPQREPLDVRTECRKFFWPRCYRTFGLRRTGNMGRAIWSGFAVVHTEAGMRPWVLRNCLEISSDTTSVSSQASRTRTHTERDTVPLKVHMLLSSEHCFTKVGIDTVAEGETRSVSLCVATRRPTNKASQATS